MDDDPFWNELAQVPADKVNDFLEKQAFRAPVAVRAAVANGFKLTAVLAAVRGFVEQSAPGMLNWESLTYRGQPYVKITPTQRARGMTTHWQDVAIYYSASGRSLTITPNERVLQHAIDRELSTAKGDEGAET